MRNLLRWYHQNRIKAWLIILAVVFAITVLQILNKVAKEEIKQENEEQLQKETANTAVSYQKESETILEGGSVPTRYREIFGDIIDEFYTNCINHNPEGAYELLAPDTKEELYPTLQEFQKLYYEERFEGDKQYSYQSWTKSSEEIYIYQVKIFENMLASGKSNDEYIEDFVTMAPVEDSYRLNINSYIGKKIVGKEAKNDQLTIEAATCDQYLNYEIYTFRVTNQGETTIMLDTKQNTKSTYITDEKGNKFNAFMYEVAKKDLILKPKEAKTIKIKFNNVYDSEKKITAIHFKDIVDYEEYQENKETPKNSIKIEI